MSDNASRVLEDGSYDALVVDADVAEGGGTVVELTIVAGAHKGEVVSVRASGIDGDPLGLLGLPATLTVAEGRPSVVFEG